MLLFKNRAVVQTTNENQWKLYWLSDNVREVGDHTSLGMRYIKDSNVAYIS